MHLIFAFLGDMTDIDSMRKVLTVCTTLNRTLRCCSRDVTSAQGAFCVIHTASPTAGAKTANERDFYFLYVESLYLYMCAHAQTQTHST